MSIEELEEEQPKEVAKKPWVPRVITGGKDGTPPAEDWLSKLKPGHTFVCRQNSLAVDFELYHVLFKGETAVLLKYCLPDGKMWDRYVSPERFCAHYRLYEILGYIKPPEEEENNE